MYLLSFLAITTIAFCSCKKEDNIVIDQNKTIALGNCAFVTAFETPMICFDSLITDSRCPVNAVCIWEGYAAVKLSVVIHTGTVQGITLSTLKDATTSIPPNETVIDGYHIKLLDVTPYPLAGSSVPGERKVLLEIKKG